MPLFCPQWTRTCLRINLAGSSHRITSGECPSGTWSAPLSLNMSPKNSLSPKSRCRKTVSIKYWPLARLSTSKVWQVSSKKTTLAEKTLLPLMGFEPSELLDKVLDPPLLDTLLDLLWKVKPDRLMVLLKESNMASIWIMIFRWAADVFHLSAFWAISFSHKKFLSVFKMISWHESR